MLLLGCHRQRAAGLPVADVATAAAAVAVVASLAALDHVVKTFYRGSAHQGCSACSAIAASAVAAAIADAVAAVGTAAGVVFAKAAVAAQLCQAPAECNCSARSWAFKGFYQCCHGISERHQLKHVGQGNDVALMCSMKAVLRPSSPSCRFPDLNIRCCCRRMAGDQAAAHVRTHDDNLLVPNCT